ncbi:MAG: glycosyltransferase, partial [Alphaproteobacteria bacterium]|nr:glycosyltransferase [Alphaproteobacteria bacterium]
NMGAALSKKAMGDFLRLANILPDLTFNLYPIGYSAEELRKENSRIKGRCHIHDAVQPEQMPRVYKQHRWLVYTADTIMKNVGWPVAVAEAQASGVGVCLANIRPDLKEYLGEGGGILFDDIEELTDILPNEVPSEMRERGFELCWRSDIAKNITELTDLWERV